MDETLNEFRASEERSKRAIADAERLAEEYRQEQEHGLHIDRMRKGLELQIKDAQVSFYEIINFTISIFSFLNFLKIKNKYNFNFNNLCLKN